MCPFNFQRHFGKSQIEVLSWPPSFVVVSTQETVQAETFMRAWDPPPCESSFTTSPLWKRLLAHQPRHWLSLGTHQDEKRKREELLMICIHVEYTVCWLRALYIICYLFVQPLDKSGQLIIQVHRHEIRIETGCEAVCKKSPEVLSAFLSRWRLYQIGVLQCHSHTLNKR